VYLRTIDHKRKIVDNSQHFKHFFRLVRMLLARVSPTYRCTDFPQLELGFGLSYPVFMVTALVGQDPLVPLFKHGISQTGFMALMKCSKFLSAACLYGAGILWTVIFDTIYAHQDYEDDCRAGVRGLAVRLGRKGTSLHCRCWHQRK
jgi:4-hydroxybenzoate polyprenyltransferase